MTQKLDMHVLKNGLVLLGEQLPGVGSAAFGLQIPCGAARLPDGCKGAGTVISDWIFRGAGERNSRELGDAMDTLGLHRSSAVASNFLSVSAAMEAGNLEQAMHLYADVILRPSLEDEQFELTRQIAIDAVRGLDDDPRKKVMLRLREAFYPDPLGRNALGTIDELQALTSNRCKDIFSQNFHSSGAILSVGGKYDWQHIREVAQATFGNLPNGDSATLDANEYKPSYEHIESDSAQVHIGLMTPTVGVQDEDYYHARVAVAILSGGMSARLFTEVREKRGLCYAVGARYHALKQMAGVTCYAGTMPEKADETASVIVSEFARLKEGVTEEELDRAKVGLKSSLVFQSESSAGTAGAIASDYYMLGRVRSVDEIKTAVDAVTVESLVKFLNEKPFGEFTAVTIGAKPIDCQGIK